MIGREKGFVFVCVCVKDRESVALVQCFLTRVPGNTEVPLINIKKAKKLFGLVRFRQMMLNVPEVE